MGVPIDRGLTQISSNSSACILPAVVEMGVPIDRGLTHYNNEFVKYAIMYVEMGVPIDRGLTHTSYDKLHTVVSVEMGVPIDRGLTHCSRPPYASLRFAA